MSSTIAGQFQLQASTSADGPEVDGSGLYTVVPAAPAALSLFPKASWPFFPGTPDWYAGSPTGVVVQVLDAYGNEAYNDSSTKITLSLATNPSGTATLTCSPNPVTDAGGWAWSTCAIGQTGDGYVLQATASGLSSASTGPFSVVAGPPPPPPPSPIPVPTQIATLPVRVARSAVSGAVTFTAMLSDQATGTGIPNQTLEFSVGSDPFQTPPASAAPTTTASRPAPSRRPRCRGP